MIPTKNWNKVSFNQDKSGIIWELTGKENKKIIDFFTFRNNNEFNLAISILKKYGYTPNKKEENEIELLKKHRETNWIDKQEGDLM
jgi:hypothetical protein